MTTAKRLKRLLISQSLFAPTDLKSAVEKLGFVQADPIRRPARAQDLILRHRVKDYRAGDLERLYPDLGIEEDYLYAYGFMSRELWRGLHPKSEGRMSKLHREVLSEVGRLGQVDSKDLEARLGKARTRNAWGGQSKATKVALEELHEMGKLRVAGRRKGIRFYETAPRIAQRDEPEVRFGKLLLATAGAMGVAASKFLLSELSFFSYLVSTPGGRKRILSELLRSGALESATVDGREYVWPAADFEEGESLERVRILAPFDPIVRERDRFAHLWGWTYRFEAYTPVAKRLRGYYAMPVLWRENMIGWANAEVVENRLKIELGYEGKRPKGKAFKTAAEKEVSAMARFLGLEESAWEAKL